MRSFGRSHSGGKSCPGGAAPCVRLCAATQPRLLRSSQRRHNRLPRAPASVRFPRFGCLRWRVRSAGPDLEFSVCDPGKLKVEREGKTHIGPFFFSRSVATKDENKEERKVRRYGMEIQTNICEYKWGKEPVYRDAISILFYSIL